MRVEYEAALDEEGSMLVAVQKGGFPKAWHHLESLVRGQGAGHHCRYAPIRHAAAQR